jgi:hypothetical protein
MTSGSGPLSVTLCGPVARARGHSGTRIRGIPAGAGLGEGTFACWSGPCHRDQQVRKSRKVGQNRGSGPLSVIELALRSVAEQDAFAEEVELGLSGIPGAMMPAIQLYPPGANTKFERRWAMNCHFGSAVEVIGRHRGPSPPYDVKTGNRWCSGGGDRGGNDKDSHLAGVA